MPKEEPTTTPERQAGIPYPGDLRDYFAAKAMQGLLITEGREVGHLRDSFEGVSIRAFKMADGMLKAREQ